MSIWVVRWTIDGYVEVEADSRNEAMMIVREMPSMEIREIGDYGHPEPYWAAEDTDTWEPTPTRLRDVKPMKVKEQYL